MSSNHIIEVSEFIDFDEISQFEIEACVNEAALNKIRQDVQNAKQNQAPNFIDFQSCDANPYENNPSQTRQNERQKIEIGDIFRQYGEQYQKNHPISKEQAKVIRRLSICRTALLGGHLDKCDNCGFERPAYNSCRNRHCPKCQSLVKEQWLNARKAELLPTGYFHLVFTLPHDLNPLILANKKILLSNLFSTVNETLQTFAGDPKWRLNGQLGMIAVLHTWSQTILDHFHLHCLIPSGALSFDKTKWTPSNKKFLFRVESVAKFFRNRYIEKLEIAFAKKELIFPGNIETIGSQNGFKALINKIRSKKWIVFAKRPFAGPEQVLEYLGRYTHRVAISNYRIKTLENGKVTFTYKDRSDENKTKDMTLEIDEFIRRFLLHVLPERFCKIRYFGFLAHRNKKKCIPLIRSLINPDAKPLETEKESIREMMLRLTGNDIDVCPRCKKGTMETINELPNLTHLPTDIQRKILDSS